MGGEGGAGGRSLERVGNPGARRQFTSSARVAIGRLKRIWISLDQQLEKLLPPTILEYIPN